MNISKKRIAFIGGSKTSAVGMAHRIAAEMDCKMQLVAGCFSKDICESRATAQKYSIDEKLAFNSIAQMLDTLHGVLDAVVVLTPQDQHYENLLELLAYDVPILCEKTLVSSVDEAVKIRHLVGESTRRLSVISNYTGYPLVRELKSYISEGGVGKVRQVMLEMPQEGFLKVDDSGNPLVPQAWRLRDGELPTVSLDLGSHLFMLLRFILNKRPVKLVGMTSTHGHFGSVVDTEYCLLKYDDDIDCSVWFTKAALGIKNGLRIRVFGSHGAAEWLQEIPEILLCADSKGNRFTLDRSSTKVKVCNQSRYQRFKVGHPAGFIEAFANYYSDYCDTIDCTTSPSSPISETYVQGVRESIECLQILQAISDSARYGSWRSIEWI
jgi:predicted dehydrogenase